MPEGVAFARLDADAAQDRFQRLRQPLGLTSLGVNLIVLEPGQRGRVHRHERQEEVYLVLAGELTLIFEDGEHVLRRHDLARVPAETRRQLVNRGGARVELLALGASGEHRSRDGIAWASWDEGDEGRTPQDVPLPDDL
jgi:uncharacterized cupin superfamily protein